MENALTPGWMRGPWLAVLTCTVALAGTAAAAQPTSKDGVRLLQGKAYATSDGHLMYLESHWLYDDAGTPARLVLYRCPDGKPFARKRLHQDGNPQAPDFVMDDARTGYQEGVRRKGDHRVVFVRNSHDAVEKTAPLDESPLPVIDAGFDAYIRAHWDSLGTGDHDSVPFLLPSRLGTLTFKVSRQADGTVEGRSARRYRLSLSSWIGFALPHIDVAYDAQSRQLLRFTGIANVRGAGGNNVRARIVFDPASNRMVDATELAAALHQPLDGRCKLP